MGSVFGNQLKLSVFGESHGGGIGVVIDGFPAGIPYDKDFILAEMARRSPGRDSAVSTPRREPDRPEVLSGVYQDRTTGAPIMAVIRNTDTRSGDYANLLEVPRPGHADYTARLRYGGFSDPRGGGHFSGRLTAPLVFAGALCKLALSRHGVTVGAHIRRIADIEDIAFDPCTVSPEQLTSLAAETMPVIDDEAGQRMYDAIDAARRELDSLGGIVECAAVGFPSGVGSPIFECAEARIASAVLSVPAVKGIEFGAGFTLAGMRGSEANDPYVPDGDGVRTLTNHNGGILGGITTGMPVLYRAVLKPTSSISRPQRSVNLRTGEPTELQVQGRHDPCVVPRAVPVLEAVTAAALLDLLLEARGYQNI